MAEKDTKTDNGENQDESPKPPPEVPPVETQHSIKAGKTTLKYTATAGMMPLKNAESGDTEANIFFMAYTLDGQKDSASRPLTFVFNGGPGSASVWLHLGAVGPKRVKMHDSGWMPKPPFTLVPNDYTWLDQSDLVFIDPVGTGYSRPVKAEDGKKYWSVEGDVKSVGEFIRLYLTRYKRWTSPLFLAGESYGTTRASALSDHLFDMGIALNGVVLISTVMNFQTIRFVDGNDLPYALYIPTYAATAWYHQKLPKDLQAKPLKELMAEVEAWAEGDYTLALGKGDQLTDRERASVINKLSRYTGLDKKFIEHSNLRIHIQRFCKELLRDQSRTVGRLDSRFKGRDALTVTEFPDFDPSMMDIMPPYTSTFNQYIRDELGYETDVNYEILSYKVNGDWEWPRMGYPNTAIALRSAMAKNPFMHVFVAQGYYDLATPHLGAYYTVNHADIDAEVRGNIHTAEYEAGHMFYLDVPSLSKFKNDITAFIKTAVGS